MFRVWTAALVAGLMSPVLAADETSDLRLEDVWIRALPASQPNTAGYLTLVNEGETAIAVVGASSNVAAKVELHRTTKVDGLMRMEQLQGVAVAPGDKVELAPGGTHLMLLGLRYMPAPGDDVRLCVQLASGTEVCAAAEVRKSGD
ncbi:MAG TPA: copper chaperone PCu(A)C [Halioglobus sp.]